MPYRIAIPPDARLAVISDPVRAAVRVVSVPDRQVTFSIAVPADSPVSVRVTIFTEGEWRHETRTQ